MARTQLVIDCADPTVLVPFWCLALDYRPAPAPDGFSTWNDWYRSVGVPDDELPADGDAVDRIEDPEGHGTPIWFQIVPEPKTIKNRLHVDVLVGARSQLPADEKRRRVDERVAALLAAGATVAYRSDDENHYAVTLHDPEGNELCVV